MYSFVLMVSLAAGTGVPADTTAPTGIVEEAPPPTPVPVTVPNAVPPPSPIPVAVPEVPRRRFLGGFWQRLFGNRCQDTECAGKPRGEFFRNLFRCKPYDQIGFEEEKAWERTRLGAPD